jgi:maltooligosyltrehalose trehalohydrolase
MVPMLFMGEEWGAKSPFPFFCDFQGDLAEAVRQGRRREFAGAYARYGDEIPDPLQPSTARSAMLDWAAADAGPGRERLRLVRELLTIRRREIVPRLAGARFGSAFAADNGLLTAHWPMGDGTTLSLIANLSDRETSHGSHEIGGTPIWGTELSQSVPPWSVFWRIG